jgi:hypothetical protein
MRAAHCNRAVSRDEHGRYVFVDATAEDVDTGGFRVIDHSVCVMEDEMVQDAACGEAFT